MHKILISIFLLLFTNLSVFSSDLPVPRWVSIKSDSANLRKGPYIDSTIIYNYQFRGYPMEIIQDAGEWKKVVDRRDGVTGWMNRILFSGKRFVITSKVPFAYGYDKPNKKIIAKISPDVHASIDQCDTKWCKILIKEENKNLKIWVEKKNLIGVYETEIIN